MKKLLLSAFVILTFVAYTLHKRFGLGDEGHKVTAPSNLSAGISSGVNSGLLNIPSASPNNQVGVEYKDGQYTGDVADAYYGNVQVNAVISGGKIVDVQFLQYPNDRRTSIQINTQAMPYLKQEAIAAQSANVDIVSGATQSSRAFRESLQSALTKAQK